MDSRRENSVFLSESIRHHLVKCTEQTGFVNTALLVPGRMHGQKIQCSRAFFFARFHLTRLRQSVYMYMYGTTPKLNLLWQVRPLPTSVQNTGNFDQPN